MYISVYIFFYNYTKLLKSTVNILYIVIYIFQSVHCKKRLDKEAYQLKNSVANKIKDSLGVWIACFLAFNYEYLK